MIGTAFSVIIRLELAGPGVQFLQSDHQLFNVIISAHAFIMIFFMVKFISFSIFVLKKNLRYVINSDINNWFSLIYLFASLNKSDSEKSNTKNFTSKNSNSTTQKKEDLNILTIKLKYLIPLITGLK
jgi:heme/copper-type cytochrome/quinol oxidase subunit 1